MTNIRTSGFGSPASLRRHLADWDDEMGTDAERDEMPQSDTDAFNPAEARREIAWLRKEVFELRERLLTIHDESELETADAPQTRGDRHPWLRIAATVATTYLLGRLVQHMRLGAPGVAAVPLIASQIDRRVW